MSLPIRVEFLNDKFDSYRLANESVSQKTHTLPAPVAVHTGGASLGLHEVKERSLHNALVPAKALDQSTQEAVAAYIDSSGNLVAATISDTAKFDTLCTIPTSGPITPSLASVDGRTWVASTGGAPELVHTENGATWHATLHVPLDACDAPWVVVRADKDSSDVLVLVQRARRVAKETEFDVALMRAAITQGATATLVWHVVGPEPVVYAHPGKAYTLGAEKPFSRHGEDVVPPYTWSQTENGVNITFDISSSVEKRDLHVEFTPDAATVRLEPAPRFTEAGPDDEKALQSENRIRAGDYIGRHLWDTIDPEGSTWTFERVSSDKHAAAHLALHLVKKHHGEHWGAVFKDGEQVRESKQPAMNEDAQEAHPSLDKYTSEEPNEHSTAGIGSKPSLLQDGLEDEDAQEGSPMQFTLVNGSSVATPREARLTLIARPAPSAGPGAYILGKHDVDGVLYRENEQWEHTETLPGIAYVLASKREAHPVYVYAEQSPAVVLAIESVRHDATAGSTSAGNIYTYKVNEDKQQGTSHVVRIGGADADVNGGLGTVQGVAVVGKEPVVAVLCERALVVLAGVL